MKVYLLTDADIDRLIAEISRDPRHGTSGGGSQVLSDEEDRAHRKAHQFYRYVIYRWLDSVKEPMA